MRGTRRSPCVWCFGSLKRASRYVLFHLPSQPVMRVGQGVLIHFANKEATFERDAAGHTALSRAVTMPSPLPPFDTANNSVGHRGGGSPVIFGWVGVGVLNVFTPQREVGWVCLDLSTLLSL